jgi:hypothetical protein
MQLLAALLVQLGRGGRQVVTYIFWFLSVLMFRGMFVYSNVSAHSSVSKAFSISRLCDMFFGSGCVYE